MLDALTFYARVCTKMINLFGLPTGNLNILTIYYAVRTADRQTHLHYAVAYARTAPGTCIACGTLPAAYATAKSSEHAHAR